MWSCCCCRDPEFFFSWCPVLPHCSNLPSSAAPLHRACPHNAQMVAIVLLCPLPHSVEQEALLCMPEGQEDWLTQWKAQKHTRIHLCLHISRIPKQTPFVYFVLIVVTAFNTVQSTVHQLCMSMLCHAFIDFIFNLAEMILDFRMWCDTDSSTKMWLAIEFSNQSADFKGFWLSTAFYWAPRITHIRLHQ